MLTSCRYRLPLTMLNEEAELDGLMKWQDGNRGPRCCVRAGDENRVSGEDPLPGL